MILRLFLGGWLVLYLVFRLTSQIGLSLQTGSWLITTRSLKTNYHRFRQIDKNTIISASEVQKNILNDHSSSIVAFIIVSKVLYQIWFDAVFSQLWVAEARRNFKWVKK